MKIELGDRFILRTDPYGLRHGIPPRHFEQECVIVEVRNGEYIVYQESGHRWCVGSDMLEPIAGPW